MRDRPLDTTGLETSRVYSRRFQGGEASRKALWKALYRGFFARWISPESTVMELAAGYCEFINEVEAARRIAVDLNPDTAKFAAAGVEVVTADVRDLSAIAPASVDVVFVSNLLEHLERPVIAETIKAVHNRLKSGGAFLILQPNIRFLARDYWMFFDHVTPIDDRALCEVLELSGFSIERCIPRFLPYTTRSRYPQSPLIVRLYLALPFAWRFFGKQAFVVARKDAAPTS